MKFLLLDMAVLASFIAVVQVLGDGGSSLLAPECHSAHAGYANRTCVSRGQELLHQEQRRPLEPSDAIVQDDNHATSGIRRRVFDTPSASPSSSDAPSRGEEEEDDKSHLKPGDIIELYAGQTYFAVPAVITGYQRDEESSTKYNLQSTITGVRSSGVASQFIHPYQVYEDGTEASCNVSATRKLWLVPCRIESHSIKNGSDLVFYRVSYLVDEDEMPRPEFIPFSRVQRVHRAAKKMNV